MLRILLELYISGVHTVRYYLHGLLPLVRRVSARTSLVFFFLVIEDNDFAERIFDLVTLLTSLISPLFEFGKRDVLNFLACFHPRASLEHPVIVCVCVTNMCNNSKLNSASQGKFLCVTYSVCALFKSKYTFAA